MLPSGGPRRARGELAAVVTFRRAKVFSLAQSSLDAVPMGASDTDMGLSEEGRQTMSENPRGETRKEMAPPATGMSVVLGALTSGCHPQLGLHLIGLLQRPVCR